MPRKAREKYPDSVYHIICRSIPEILLFRDDDDKHYYLALLKRYKDRYHCRIYTYCLMDNHLHLHLDPRGFDVSKFMHSTNTAYVRYYNKKYSRYGHVFQDRFQSRILDTDEYHFSVSAYIHNNPHDIESFKGKEESYPFSSLDIYLGIRKDTLGLIDKTFMMSLFHLHDEKAFAQRYKEFVYHKRDIGDFAKLEKKLGSAVEIGYASGRQVILRDLPPSKAMSFIANRMMVSIKDGLAIKSKQKLMQFRAFTAYVLRVFCGLSYKEICGIMFNITISGCSRLCSKGYELISSDPYFKEILDDLLLCQKAA